MCSGVRLRRWAHIYPIYVIMTHRDFGCYPAAYLSAGDEPLCIYPVDLPAPKKSGVATVSSASVRFVLEIVSRLVLSESTLLFLISLCLGSMLANHRAHPIPSMRSSNQSISVAAPPPPIFRPAA